MAADERLARDLRLAVGRVARRLRQLYVETEDGLSFLELAVLQRLERDGPASPGALATAEGVTSAAIAAVLRRLVAGRLVKRTPDPTDRRRVVVTVGASGRRALNARETASVAAIETGLSALTGRERQRLADAVPLLERLAAQL